MITLAIYSRVCNAAAVFSKSYGAVARRAAAAGCSRQTVYDHARQIEQQLQRPVSTPPTAPVEAPEARIGLDQATLRRFAVTAFAMGVSTRQIEDLFHVILGDDAPDHSSIGRWVKEAAEKARPVLETLDAAATPRIQSLAVDEVFFGGGRPWWGSSRPA
jgi:hypothetical protein